MTVDRKGAGITIEIRVVPRAARNEIVGMYDGALKVRVASPPVDGAANLEITKILSKAFGVSKSDITILSGHTSRRKMIKINSADNMDIESILKAKT